MKRGRPIINPENKNSKFVGIFLTEKDRLRLKEASAYEGMPVSTLTRKVIKDYLDQLDRDFVTADLLFGGKEE